MMIRILLPPFFRQFCVVFGVYVVPLSAPSVVMLLVVVVPSSLLCISQSVVFPVLSQRLLVFLMSQEGF